MGCHPSFAGAKSVRCAMIAAEHDQFEIDEADIVGFQSTRQFHGFDFRRGIGAHVALLCEITPAPGVLSMGGTPLAGKITRGLGVLLAVETTVHRAHDIDVVGCVTLPLENDDFLGAKIARGVTRPREFTPESNRQTSRTIFGLRLAESDGFSVAFQAIQADDEIGDGLTIFRVFTRGQLVILQCLVMLSEFGVGNGQRRKQL